MPLPKLGELCVGSEGLHRTLTLEFWGFIASFVVAVEASVSRVCGADERILRAHEEPGFQYGLRSLQVRPCKQLPRGTNARFLHK